ncbi:MAG: hypothetical protein WCK64_07270 [Synechococcaceae cyanobacterium ELA445]
MKRNAVIATSGISLFALIIILLTPNIFLYILPYKINDGPWNPPIFMQALTGKLRKVTDTGYSSLSVSKSCDELAPKFLKESFSLANKNNGEHTESIAVINNLFLKSPKTIDMRAIYIAKGTLYKVESTGTVSSLKFKVETTSGNSLTKPKILSNDQIVCEYPMIVIDNNVIGNLRVRENDTAINWEMMDINVD